MTPDTNRPTVGSDAIGVLMIETLIDELRDVAWRIMSFAGNDTDRASEEDRSLAATLVVAASLIEYGLERRQRA